MPVSKSRPETEEQRAIRKKREMEKMRLEGKIKEPHRSHHVLSSSGSKPAGSVIGSQVIERKTNPLLAGDRGENKLKKPTTFLCKMK